MAPCRKTPCGRRLLAGVALVAACCGAGSAFVAGGRGTQKSLRGQEGHYAQLKHDAQTHSQDFGRTPSQVTGSLFAAAVALGLVAGMATQPAQAALGTAQVSAVKAIEVSDSSLSVAMKSFVNPSDELDADEQPFEDWSAENPVQLILTGLIPVFIYLTFYILGSLEVI
eukprot:TRINITY_DN5795_c1_g3_i1.p1 TRINITY_DN5795_c1_g3~~TRINITY_DN5795_c1_g3_i1.p1  ORF type:complete len:169 (+),score=38.37 TRINITY_DN5795_c1_g3_i1:65-571(+)